jgi:Spy/CpxP family protein refolding chaperone
MCGESCSRKRTKRSHKSSQLETKYLESKGVIIMAIFEFRATGGGTGRPLLKSVLAGLGAGLITLCLATAAWSMPTGGDRHPNPEKMLEMMSEKLELDEGQRAAIGKVLAQAEEESEADRERMLKLREMIDEGAAMDNTQIEALANEMGELTTRMVRGRLTTQAGIQALLNDEQREEMAELLEHRKKRNEHRRSHWFHRDK